MRRPIYWIGLTTALLVALPAFADDNQKPKSNDEPVEASLIWTNTPIPDEIAPATLESLPETAGATFTVRVQYQGPDPKNNAQTGQPGQGTGAARGQQQEQRDLTQITRLQQEIARASRNPREAARVPQLQAQLQLEYQKLQQAAGMAAGKLVTLHKDIIFETSDDLKIRSMIQPEQFDEKGNPKKYTSEELRKLKDPKSPSGTTWYISSVDQLKKGQIVKLYVRKRKVKKDDDKPAETSKSADKGTDKPAETSKSADKGTDKPAAATPDKTATAATTPDKTATPPTTPDKPATPATTPDKGLTTTKSATATATSDKTTSTTSTPDKGTDKSKDKPDSKQMVVLILILQEATDSAATKDKNDK